MKILILIAAILATEPPRKKLMCTGKAHETESSLLSSDSHDYYLYFEDGTTVKTSRKYYACYEHGDSAVFFFRAFYDKDGRYKRSEWQMYNKCPHELR
jgi:hypothetical protein